MGITEKSQKLLQYIHKRMNSAAFLRDHRQSTSNPVISLATDNVLPIMIGHGLLPLQDGKLFDAMYLTGENIKYK